MRPRRHLIEVILSDTLSLDILLHRLPYIVTNTMALGRFTYVCGRDQGNVNEWLGLGGVKRDWNESSVLSMLLVTWV